MVKFSVVAEHLLYHLILFWVAFALYRAIGFDQTNFTFVNNRNNHADSDLMTCLWYTVGNHIHMGTGDVMPTSPLARAFTALHVIATFVLYAGIVLLMPGQSGVNFSLAK